MTAAMRMNPGMRALMDSILGKRTEGMDQTKAMMELVQRLAKMPHFIGAQFAQMFGIDERTFFMMKQEMPKLLAAERERREMNRLAGVDADRAAEAGKRYEDVLRRLATRIEVLGSKLSIALLPYFEKFSVWLDKNIVDLQRWVGTPGFNKTIKEWSASLQGFIDDLRDLGDVIGDVYRDMKEFFADTSFKETITTLVGWVKDFYEALTVFRRLKSPQELEVERQLLGRPAEEGPGAWNWRSIFGAAMPDFRPLGGAPALAGGGGPVTINQTNNFDVKGSDAQATAQAVAGMVGGAARSAVRDLKGGPR
jgi:hypothetical protein